MGRKRCLALIGFVAATAPACSSQGQLVQEVGGIEVDDVATALSLTSSDASTIAAIEAEGRAFPRGGNVAPELRTSESLIEERRYADVDGTSARECTQMESDTARVFRPGDFSIRRSGEFVVGAEMFRLANGDTAKVWWKPLNSSVEMRLSVRGRRLGADSTALLFESSVPAGSKDSRTLEWIPESMFFPSGFGLPLPGRWVVIATSGTNWGCFIMNRR